MTGPIEIAADIVANWETSGAGYGDLEDRIESALRKAYETSGDRGCRWCQAFPGEWCVSDCGGPSPRLHPDYRGHENPTGDLWSKRNTPSGHFTAIKRSGDVFKGVKREN